LKKLFKLVGWVLLLSLLLGGCDSLPFNLPWMTEEMPSSTVTEEVIDETLMTPEATITEDIVEGPITQLTIWVPPDMDPDLGTEASQFLTRQLSLFSEDHGGLEIIIRVKAESGASGLLDSLTATSIAAPNALPDLIALSRTDLETAALKNLIYPLDALTDIPDDPDWYPFAREMALLQGSTFGFPFAADALVQVYRPSEESEYSGALTDLLEGGTVLSFPAGSDLSLFTFALYQSEGGQFQDSQRRPVLETEPLVNVFQFISDGIWAGIFQPSLADLKTDDQVWKAFQEGEHDLAVTWVTNYLQEGPADTILIPLLMPNEKLDSIGSGWSWAVSTPNNTRQVLAVELAEFLVAADFLASWSDAAGFIPTRPSALEGWRDQNLRATISQIALTAHLLPSNDIMASIGPVLRDGTLQVLQDQDPEQAALEAVEKLEE
jgi:ABC-type glycerol-3-phosphate transport system substrate-binding protein